MYRDGEIMPSLSPFLDPSDRPIVEVENKLGLACL